MSRRQPESKIVNAILAALNDLPQTYARKAHGSAYNANFPDIVVGHRGRIALIEVKQPGKDATPRQAHELAKWRQAGALVGVAHDVDEALAVIEYEPVLTREQVEGTTPAGFPIVLTCAVHGDITDTIRVDEAGPCINRHRLAGCRASIRRRVA